MQFTETLRRRRGSHGDKKRGESRRTIGLATDDVFGVFSPRCKRLNELGGHDMVFAKASPASLAVKAAAWSEPAQRFLKRCADAGNLEACYILGMVRNAQQP